MEERNYLREGKKPDRVLRKSLILATLITAAYWFSPGLIKNASDDYFREGNAIYRTENDKVLAEAAYRIRYGKD